MVVVADAEHAVPWTKPADFPVDKRKPAAGLARGRGGVLTVAGADGFALTLPGDIDMATLWSLLTRPAARNLTGLGMPAKRGGASCRASTPTSPAGGAIGYPADVMANFKSAKKPLPHGIEQQVAEKLQRIAPLLLNEMEVHGQFPPAAICDKSGKPLLSWRVKLLPVLNEEALYNQFHLDEPWDSQHNLPLVKKMPDIYLNPKLGRLEGKPVFLLPTGKETMFFDDKGARPSEITDGRGKTIMVVVADAEHAVPWTKPDDLLIDSASPARGLERWPDHFFMLALANAQIALLPDDIEPTTLWGFFTRAGGERLAVPPQAPGKNR